MLYVKQSAISCHSPLLSISVHILSVYWSTHFTWWEWGKFMCPQIFVAANIHSSSDTWRVKTIFLFKLPRNKYNHERRYCRKWMKYNWEEEGKERLQERSCGEEISRSQEAHNISTWDSPIRWTRIQILYRTKTLWNYCGNSVLVEMNASFHRMMNTSFASNS